MFTVKQVTDIHEKMWPRISCVDAMANNSQGQIDFISALQQDGGELQFHSGFADQTIYVMNETGATVARYRLAGHGKAAEQIRPTPETALAA